MKLGRVVAVCFQRLEVQRRGVGTNRRHQSEQSSGLYRTLVGEHDWQVPRNGLPEKVEVRTFAIHPTTPRTVYVGTQDGPYRSRDSGEHWERLPFPDKNMVVWSILLHPHNPRTLFVGTAPPAVYRSDDGGEHWRRLPIVEPADMVQMGFPCRIIRLAADPSNPHELYAGIEVGGVIRGLDGGNTWSDCTKELLAFTQQDHLKSQIASKTQIEGMMDSHVLGISTARPGIAVQSTMMTVALSREDAKVVYGATRKGQVLGTHDGGATWRDYSLPAGRQDVYALACG